MILRSPPFLGVQKEALPIFPFAFPILPDPSAQSLAACPSGLPVPSVNPSPGALTSPSIARITSLVTSNFASSERRFGRPLGCQASWRLRTALRHFLHTHASSLDSTWERDCTKDMHVTVVYQDMPWFANTRLEYECENISQDSPSVFSQF